LLFEHRKRDAACTVLSAIVDDPRGRDRVVRDAKGMVSSITAEVDLVGEERSINEVALGIYCIRRGLLAPAARRTSPALFDGRHRLADVLGVLAESGHPVASAHIDTDPVALRPVDDRRQLAEAEAELRRRTNALWMDRGVTMIDPDRTYVDSTVQLGVDVTLFPGTMLQGKTVIGDGCEIGPDSRLDRCIVGRNSIVEKTMARGARVGDHCRVGPFAVIEPGADLADGTVTGPFYAARTND
jgi:bifunctional UDP-N-acetylglucosamine pyrophosphorylase/glucosamine-1-phosphate N-acetyltransferase